MVWAECEAHARLKLNNFFSFDFIRKSRVFGLNKICIYIHTYTHTLLNFLSLTGMEWDIFEFVSSHEYQKYTKYMCVCSLYNSALFAWPSKFYALNSSNFITGDDCGIH